MVNPAPTSEMTTALKTGSTTATVRLWTRPFRRSPRTTTATPTAETTVARPTENTATKTRPKAMR